VAVALFEPAILDEVRNVGDLVDAELACERADIDGKGAGDRETSADLGGEVLGDAGCHSRVAS
jgi:hypothetical protein